jgi:hypothetical protein
MTQEISSLVSSVAHRLTRSDARQEDHQKLTNSFDESFDAFVAETQKQLQAAKVQHIIQEGLVTCMKIDTSVDSLSESLWEKCRLQLFKQNEVATLHFFIPTKSKKAKHEVHCSSILEVRSTTALELPDEEHTFVIKVCNNLEYIVQTKSEQEMKSWISSIKNCMDSKSKSNKSAHEDTPLKMTDYPWFHDKLPRAEAGRLVVKDGFFGHGRFLIRESATRKGEVVVTFNFEGRAKHLRVHVSEEGQCRVQHFWFKTIIDMIEYFKMNSIPLESEASPVILTDYVSRS